MSYEESYAIPSEIKAKFSEDFYKTFWEELDAVFEGKTKGVDPCLTPNVYYFSSTCGWSDALKATCAKLGLGDVWSYYSQLEYYDSDRFDGELEEELAKRFSKPTNADRLRAMSNEDLADFIQSQIIDRNIGIPKETWLEWLNKESTVFNNDN